MTDPKARDIYARTPDGAIQLAASSDRWHLFDDHVHLAPHRAGDPRLRRFEAEPMPFVDVLDRGALLVIDMQNQVLRTQGISTLYFAGVNIDQCVATTMEEACFRDFNCVLLEDACATSSPAYCKDAVVFNAKQCWGFSTTTAHFAAPRPVG